MKSKRQKLKYSFAVLGIFLLFAFGIFSCTGNGSGVAPENISSAPSEDSPTSPDVPSTPASGDTSPVANSITPANFNEDTQSLITLSYSDVDGDQATSCSVSNLTQVSITQSCTCSSGVCEVGVTGLSNYNGSASFNYTVTAGGALSNSASATLTILSVPDITSGTFSLSGQALNDKAKTISFSSGFTFDENILDADICISEDLNANSTLDSSEQCNKQGYIDISSQISASGTHAGSWSNYILKSGTNGASFTLTSACSSSANYFTSLKLSNSIGNSVVQSEGPWKYWLPSCLGSNLKIWLDSNDAGSIYSDSSCTTLASNNGPVGCWKDKSGNSNHVTQSNGSQQPTYVATENKINFNGSTVLMGPTSVNPYSITANRGLFAAFKLNNDIPTGGYIADRSRVSNELFGIFRDGRLEVRGDSNAGYVYFGSAVTSGTISNWSATLEGTTARQWVNGSLGASQTLTTGVISQPGASIGRHVSTVVTYSLDFNEYIFTNSALSNSDINNVQGYLAWKWGVQSNLPTSHTYYNSAP